MTDPYVLFVCVHNARRWPRQSLLDLLATRGT